MDHRRTGRFHACVRHDDRLRQCGDHLPRARFLRMRPSSSVLMPSTLYHYCITATDLAGNITNSCGHSFTTGGSTSTAARCDPAGDNLRQRPPCRHLDGHGELDDGRDRERPGGVRYIAFVRFILQPRRRSSLTHQVQLAGLAASTTYHYRVRSSDESGNVSL